VTAPKIITAFDALQALYRKTDSALSLVVYLFERSKTVVFLTADKDTCFQQINPLGGSNDNNLAAKIGPF